MPSTTSSASLPRALSDRWLAAAGRERPLSFHLESGSGAPNASWFHWAREKARAEQMLVLKRALHELFDFNYSLMRGRCAD